MKQSFKVNNLFPLILSSFYSLPIIFSVCFAFALPTSPNQTFDMIKLLLDRGVCPNAGNGRPIPTLMMPFITPMRNTGKSISIIDLVQLLLEHGADPNVCMPSREHSTEVGFNCCHIYQIEKTQDFLN